VPATVFRRSLWHDHVSGRVVCKKGLVLCPLRVIMLIVSVEGGISGHVRKTVRGSRQIRTFTNRNFGSSWDDFQHIH
jgi:hypothetical protein